MAAIRRVRDRSTFAALGTAGRRAGSGPLRVTFLPDAPAGGAGPPRVAYAVGRRTGPAVTRNRVRRRLRAAAAELGADLAPGAYLLSFRGDPTTPFAELRDHLAAAARSAGALEAA